MSKFCFLFISYTLFTSCLISCGVVNTGTVLFSIRDVSRQCWHPEEIAVLTTRLILQDLLPDVSSIEISSNDYVDDIVEYFRILFEVIQKSTQGRTRYITMLAMSDLIGGYLQYAILPMSRYAYYAGVIDFPSVEKLIQLYEELKWYLRTNGQGWARPVQPKNEFDIEPIDLSREGVSGNKSCCRNLIYYHGPPAKRESEKKEKSAKLFFPIPFFDSKVRPSSIAIPFRKFALRNIESRRAAYMVLKYYVSVHNCLMDLHADKSTIESFQNNLYTWIEQNVIPKLKDDKFYSAFGGIIRVEESLKSEGARFTSSVAGTECVENEGDQEVGTVPGGESSSRSSVILIAMLVTIFIWFIIGTLFICYRMRAGSKKGAQMNIGGVSTESSSSFGSSSKWSSKRTLDTCKCCTTTTEKSTELSLSSEFDKEEDQKPGKQSSKSFLKGFSFTDKLSKRDEAYGRTCFCDGPPTIDHKHSMKLLPSIPEMSEHSSSKREDRVKQSSKSKKISFGRQMASSSIEEVAETKKRSKIRICVPRMSDVDITACPHYNNKATSLSSFKSKSSNGDEENEAEPPLSEPGTDPIPQPEFDVIKEEKVDTNENTTEETSDNTAITANSPHIYACHSSLTGNYTTDQRFQADKPFIFGYDFQTSSSSELSDEESDARTSTTK